jgi:hypothetical protein
MRVENSGAADARGSSGCDVVVGVGSVLILEGPRVPPAS